MTPRARLVPDKSRQKTKKPARGSDRRAKKASAATRRTSQASRHAGRAAPVAKATSRPKPGGEGAPSGMTVNKKTTQRQGFKTNEFVVYPAHGV
ncbi:MAG: CarD family transcriptional regulator, partial [Pseudorhodoplanes sp.]